MSAALRWTAPPGYSSPLGVGPNFPLAFPSEQIVRRVNKSDATGYAYEAWLNRTLEHPVFDQLRLACQRQ